MIGRTYRSRRHKSAVLLFGRAYSKAGIGPKELSQWMQPLYV